MGAETWLVSFAGAERAEAFRQELGLSMPCLLDNDRALYQAYGLARGSAWQIFHPRVFARYLTLIARHRPLRRPVDDPYQLGGDVVIGKDGRILWIYRSRTPADRPSVDRLLQYLGDPPT